MDEMQAVKGQQQLARSETLHVASVLRELDPGYFTGMSRRTSSREDRWWKDHLLGAMDGIDVPTMVTSTSRLEFQDGKRKAAMQSYHGRGNIHSHSLVFLQNREHISLQCQQ